MQLQKRPTAVFDTINKLTKAGFLYEAFNLNDMNYWMNTQVTKKDEQTVNYLNHFLYCDDMYSKRNQIKSLKSKYLRNNWTDTDAILFKVFREIQPNMKGDSVLHNPFFSTTVAMQLY